ncbi:DUF3861 domain-containing protein [Sedimenticola thiotaurini]|uniref:DUF3861 domain-containing protein n=1 Tax=Sedimenticola thiotaurini TaxID=1543721 RepID=A0A0F7K1U4_9GAMM|nr:DUF3861 domain-containing protein [Sedimenticola thiotaurini]AKH21862.1 hypothetical protein AAY24_17655 [Sedimenticola thiotaurini]
MAKHKYRVTLEHLSNPKGEISNHSPLQIEVDNHDDIFKIVELMRNRDDLGQNDAAALAIGIKLFGEVMLDNRDNPLFAAFMKDFSRFMKALKAGNSNP